MEIMEIIPAILLLSLFVIINFLDRWSTSTLFKFNDKTSNDEVFRNRMLAYRKSKGKLNMELNSLARVFMKKYGIEKGMKIFTVIWEIPLLVSIFVIVSLSVIYIPVRMTCLKSSSILYEVFGDILIRSIVK